MRHFKIVGSIIGLLFLVFTLFGNAGNGQIKEDDQRVKFDDLLIRIAEIEVDASSLDEYIAILKEEAEASVRLEKGVLCIFPMYHKENPTQVRILEIYADQSAYESHLQTAHFRKYKTTTLEMVKSVDLIDMAALDRETMSSIFRKLGQHH